VIIREASPADIPAVVRVHVAAWDAAKEGLDVPTRRTPEQRTELWTTFLTQRRGPLWVAQVEGSAVGFIALGPSRDDDRQGETEIYTLYVDPEAWGRGCGSALIGKAPEDGPVSLWVFTGNERARRFYARHGFQPDGSTEEGHHGPNMRLARSRAVLSPG